MINFGKYVELKNKQENEDNKEKDNKQKKVINKDTSLDSDLFFLDNIIDYRCIICEYVPSPENAYDIKCCGILICEDCLRVWISLKQICPLCKKTLKFEPKYVRNIKENNKIFYNSMRKFIIKCPYKCEWVGEWGELESHLNECKNSFRACKYKYLGCEFVDENNKVLEHENENNKTHLELAMKYIKDYSKQKLNIIEDNNIDNNINNNSNNSSQIIDDSFIDEDFYSDE